MKKTVKELTDAGGTWVDMRWHDFIRMPDGSYWRPIHAVPHVTAELMMERYA